MTTDEDTYAPIIQARHERRAATIAGDVNFYTPASPKDVTSPKYDAHEGSYKSLNEYLMDDQQVYEDPNGVRGGSFNGGDEHGEWRGEEEQSEEEYDEGNEADEDSDLDSIYMAAIVRNTGRSTIATTTPTSDREAGLLLRDIPLPPQCPIPMPPNSKLPSPPMPSSKLPGINLMPPRSPSPMPPGGPRGNSEIPPPPSVHLIPSHGANPPPATTIPVSSAGGNEITPPPPPSVHLIPSRGTSPLPVTTLPVSSAGGTELVPPPPPSVHLIPPHSTTTGQGTPRRNPGGREIPPPRILNLTSPNTSCRQLRQKGQSPTLSPLIAQRLKSLVPVARVSMDGEYVVPNEALEAEGDILSHAGEAEEEEGEEGELPDYIDISS